MVDPYETLLLQAMNCWHDRNLNNEEEGWHCDGLCSFKKAPKDRKDTNNFVKYQFESVRVDYRYKFSIKHRSEMLRMYRIIPWKVITMTFSNNRWVSLVALQNTMLRGYNLDFFWRSSTIKHGNCFYLKVFRYLCQLGQSPGAKPRTRTLDICQRKP